MKIVLLSGGSGTRLWPLSSETRSKQFLKLLKDNQGSPQSMVQRVYGQLQQAGFHENLTVATSDSQVVSIQNQLGNEVHLVVEPSRRNTFPAIALACANLYWDQGVSLDEVIVVLPVDPFAEIGYFKTLICLEDTIRKESCNLALMGVKPTYPSAKYGYMIPAPEAGSENIPIVRFQEKPHRELARELIQAGALWNCGVFAFQLGYALGHLQRYIQAESYDDVLRQYEQLPRQSFDYEVVEKESSIFAVEYDGYWKDLGTWNTFTEQMEHHIMGSALLDNTCKNTHVLNELDIPIVVMGAEDMVVAASYDGILVADKGQSSYLKPLVEKINNRPMYEERIWGNYRVLDYVTHTDGSKCLTKRLFIEAGKSISYQYHNHRKEVWTIASGIGELLLDGKTVRVACGDVITIPIKAKHKITALDDLEIIEVQIGDYLEEQDIVRILS